MKQCPTHRNDWRSGVYGYLCEERDILATMREGSHVRWGRMGEKNERERGDVSRRYEMRCQSTAPRRSDIVSCSEYGIDNSIFPHSVQSVVFFSSHERSPCPTPWDIDLPLQRFQHLYVKSLIPTDTDQHLDSSIKFE